MGSENHRLYAINPDGTKKWTFSTLDRVDSSPVIGIDGTIYMSSDGQLYAINQNGMEKWVSFIWGSVFSSPALAFVGTIYVGSGNRLWAIDLNGENKWAFVTESNVWSSPAIGSNGTVYVGSSDKILSFLDAFSKESSPALKDLTKRVKKEILKKQSQDQPFLGFRLLKNKSEGKLFLDSGFNSKTYLINCTKIYY